MAKLIDDDLRLCVDCVQILANGEINDGTDYGERHVEIMDRWYATWWASNGRVSLVVGEPHADFSDVECDGCGTILAGERWTGVALI